MAQVTTTTTMARVTTPISTPTYPSIHTRTHGRTNARVYTPSRTYTCARVPNAITPIHILHRHPSTSGVVGDSASVALAARLQAEEYEQHEASAAAAVSASAATAGSASASRNRPNDPNRGRRARARTHTHKHALNYRPGRGVQVLLRQICKLTSHCLWVHRCGR